MISDATRCPGCELREQLQEQIPHSAKGMKVVLLPNPELMPKAPEEAP